MSQEPSSQFDAHWQWALKQLAAGGNIVDLGCGNNPVSGATVAVDCYIEPAQRGLGQGQHIDVERLTGAGIRFVNARIDERLPFGDKEFDFAYSSHAFEHTDHPEIACAEMMRIARAGVIITPSIFAETAFGRPYHKWMVIAGDNEIIFLEKMPEEDRPFGNHPNPFDVILDYEGWVEETLDGTGLALRKIFQREWHRRTPVMETIFPWRDGFTVKVVRNRRSPVLNEADIETPRLPHGSVADTVQKTPASRHEYYLSRLPIYKILAQSNLADPAVRHSRELAVALSDAGMWNPDLTDYWMRVTFIADNCWGYVLEIGAASGNITRHIAANSAVSKVTAVDLIPEFVEALAELRLDKVEAICADVTKHIPPDRYDTVVLAEVIEHLSLEDELTLIKSIKESLSPGSNFIITTPIGFMPDPDHLRGFSREQFVAHLQHHYGAILLLADNGIQQFAVVSYLGGEHG